MTRLSRSLACLAILPLLIGACAGAASTPVPPAGGGVATPTPGAATPAATSDASFALPSFALSSFSATGDVTVKLDASGTQGLAAHYEAKPTVGGCTIGLIGTDLFYFTAAISDQTDVTAYDKNWSATITTDMKAPAQANTQILFTFGDPQMSDPTKLARVYSASGGIGKADVKVDDGGSTVTVKATGTARDSFSGGPDLTFSLEVACNNVKRP